MSSSCSSSECVLGCNSKSFSGSESKVVTVDKVEERDDCRRRLPPVDEEAFRGVPVSRALFKDTAEKLVDEAWDLPSMPLRFVNGSNGRELRATYPDEAARRLLDCVASLLD